MWAIVTPIFSIPLLVVLLIRKLRDGRSSTSETGRPKILQDVRPNDSIWTKTYKIVWVELDFLGCLLLIAGLALILVPVSLTGAKNSEAWSQGSFIAMVVTGAALFIAFLIWDGLFAKKPFVPFKLIRQRTIIAACVMSMLDFMHYSLFSVFFPSYLQVASNFSAGHATRIE